MGFKITFEAGSDVADGHKIYRSQTPMTGTPSSELPEPLVTLPLGVSEWEDGTVVVDETYYYRIAAFLGAAQAFSEEIEVVAEGEAPEPLFEAILSFGPTAIAGTPVNFFTYGGGLSGILSLGGGSPGWSISHVGGTPYNNELYSYTDNTYVGLPWPAKPLDGGTDYLIITSSSSGSVDYLIEGLNPQHRYNLRFTGARQSSGSRDVRVGVWDEVLTMDAVNNQSGELFFGGVETNAAGEIEFSVLPSQGSYNYVSALWIEEKQVSPNTDAPLLIPSLWQYYSGSSLAGMADGAPLSEWADLIGNVTATQTDSAKQPTVVAAGLNNLSGVLLTAPQGLNLSKKLTSTSHTIFAVIRADKQDQNTVATVMRNGRGSFYFNGGGDSLGIAGAPHNTLPEAAVGDLTDGTGHGCFISVASGSASEVYYDNELAARGSSSRLSDGDPTIGFRDSDGFRGEIYELAVWTRALTESERNQLFTWASNKYGIEVT